mmetsp:Transcript_110795/g.278522  ORF Transcript_110795/g.278522 Transcript_110795/m.278522 type:complete len:453 (-) Transcript_110795:47-1405(-)
MTGVAHLLQPGEEDWQDILERLCERFETYGPERVVKILRDCNGHAGQAASTLRDLAGTEMRPVDPDDAEHVRTLLCSPLMFSHACKEHFRRYDVNGDGALEWSEIVGLVNALYENFGLQPPREGGLKAFFEATDTNGDGVLSEKEFKHFFECFLRYAFFDVVNHEQKAKEPQGSPAHAKSHHQEGQQTGRSQHRAPKEPSASPPRRSERSARSAAGSPSAAGGGGGGRVGEESLSASPQPAASRHESRRHHHGGQAELGAGVFRCYAPQGMAYRQSPDLNSPSDTVGVQKGEVVQALEHWIRTPQGWLPVAISTGERFFEPSSAVPKASRSSAAVAAAASPDQHQSSRSSKRVSRSTGVVERSEGYASVGGEGRRDREKAPPAAPVAPVAGAGGGGSGSGGLRPGEEEWQGVFERLSLRFPTATSSDVAQALRDYGGHAGQAAQRLRALTAS